LYVDGAVIFKYYVHIDPSFMQKMIPCMLVLIVLLPAWQAGLTMPTLCLRVTNQST